MTKAELITVMAKNANSSKASAEKAIDAFITGVFDSLRKGRRVTISGFGTFVVTKRAARNGRNPRTGGEMHLPACKVPRFRPSRGLKTAVK